jgi:hypothetical protein
MRRQVLFAAWLALLQGCATEPASQVPFARPPDLTPIEASGDYMHEQSQAVVPEQYAGFRRVAIFRRGSDGQRLTVSYSGGSAECLTAITLFLDPAEQTGSVDKAFAKAKAEVLHAYPSAVLDHEDARDDAAVTGKRAVYRIDDKGMEVGVVQNRKAWDVKHRVIFPARCATEVLPAVNEFFPGWQR